jgi:hypothetical protein
MLIKPFARLHYWRRDDIPARIYVKARVAELEDVPHYLIFTEGDDHEGFYLTVQCEIVHQDMLGGQLPDEDIPPGWFDDDEFIFPGFWGNQFQHFHGAQGEQGQQGNNLNHPVLPDLNENMGH